MDIKIFKSWRFARIFTIAQLKDSHFHNFNVNQQRADKTENREFYVELARTSPAGARRKISGCLTIFFLITCKVIVSFYV